VELTPADRAAFDGRPHEVDYGRRDTLHHLGEYRRELPNSITRMIENAYDWEHLPFVHPTSFADIELVEQGGWGWRCITALPNEGGAQAVELLVDKPNNYWATTVVEGFGKGVEIHTHASASGEDGIVVSVNFYLPQPPESDVQGQMLLAALTHQYATLYDEDEALMTGRQAALDQRSLARGETLEAGTVLEAAADIDPAAATLVTIADRRIVLRHVEGRWIAHSAACPHMLGPLLSHDIEEGRVTCPWHGYSFSLSDGEETRSRCAALKVARVVEDEAGSLVLEQDL
jgi:nitrite reductase/ring-hydroxylating ferredoxin subunit